MGTSTETTDMAVSAPAEPRNTSKKQRIVQAKFITYRKTRCKLPCTLFAETYIAKKEKETTKKNSIKSLHKLRFPKVCSLETKTQSIDKQGHGTEKCEGSVVMSEEGKEG